MLNRLSNKAMVKVVAIVGVMLAILLLSSTSLWAQDSEMTYKENDDRARWRPLARRTTTVTPSCGL